ncbi:MAG: hypothetical protein IT462_02710 [Planctomycetes bacterium]|nr:hypothetical protein [Planctomycetota bacterium]
MQKLLCAMVVALTLIVPAAAEDKGAKEAPATPPKEKVEPKKDDPKADKKDEKAEVDALKIYRTKGNTWTFKLLDGTFEKHEVSEVTAKKASIKLTTLDKAKKETAMDFYSVDLKAAKKADAATPSKIEAEKFTAGEVTLECTHAQFFSSGGTLHIWTSTEFSLVIKEQWVSKTTTETRRELVEFSAK